MLIRFKVLSILIVFLGISTYLFSSSSNIEIQAQSCTGTVNCLHKACLNAGCLSFTCNQPPSSGGGICAPQTTQAACSQEELDKFNSCPDPECSNGGCTFTPGTPPPPPPPPPPPGPPPPAPPPPPGGSCSCNWQPDASCGDLGCGATERHYVLVCNPAGCDSGAQCFPAAECVPPPPGSSTPTPPPVNTPPTGNHDGFSGNVSAALCRAGGWATDPTNTSQHVNLRVLADANPSPVQTGIANAFRRDLDSDCSDGLCANVCPGSGGASGGFCAFDLNLSGTISTGVNHTITVQAQDTTSSQWYSIGSTPKTINCCTNINTTPAFLTPNTLLACGTNSTTFNWGAVAGATYYSIRVDDQANPWTGNCAALNPGDQCMDTATNGTSQIVNGLTPGHSYDIWVDARNSCGDFGPSKHSNFAIMSSLSLTPSPVVSIPFASNQTFTATPILPGGYSVSRVDFDSSSPAVVSLNPISDPSSPYTTVGTGVTTGISNITAAAYNGSGALLCNSNNNTNVVATVGPNNVGWWQVGGGDVVSHGDLVSHISTTCSGACVPIFNLQGLGTFPGTNIYSGSADFSQGAGGGTGGQGNNWNAVTSTSLTTLNYAFFKNQLTPDILANVTELRPSTPGCSGIGGVICAASTFTSGGTLYKGYYWYHYDGSFAGNGSTLTLSQDTNITGGRRVILLIEYGDLALNGRVNIDSSTQSFFMAIAGKNGANRGNIIVSPAVTSANANDFAVEGIYFAEGEIQTGISAGRLAAHGSFVALNGFSLDRVLPDNAQAPAEYFQYAPEYEFSYPPVFASKKVQWQEVVP